jgi:RNA-directed DNA polymerase
MCRYMTETKYTKHHAILEYSFLSTRVNNLLIRQNGKYKSCRFSFRIGNIMEVDHIIPISKGSKDEYTNLQLPHR